MENYFVISKKKINIVIYLIKHDWIQQNWANFEYKFEKCKTIYKFYQNLIDEKQSIEGEYFLVCCFFSFQLFEIIILTLIYE